MKTYSNVCPNCFEQLLPGATMCSKCTFDKGKYTHNSTALPLYTMLNDQYLIGRVLGQGGFGITYKALDTLDNKIVAVKEYMPSEYSERVGKNVSPLKDDAKAMRVFEHGKSSYIDEIRTLHQFKNSDGIVKIYTHFQENNTAYLVMEYLDGRNLKSFVKNKGGSISSKLAGGIIIKAAAALEKVHSANVLHRDISPENIFIMRNDVDVKLIDFGAARRNVEDSDQEKSVLLKPGFAPPEQYSKKGNQGTWTDVYALAASLYYLVSGVIPTDSMSRMQHDDVKSLDKICSDVNPAMATAVTHAMEIDYTKRTRTCTEFIKELRQTGWDDSTKIGPAPIFISKPPVQPPPPPPPPQRRQIICNVKCVSGMFNGRQANFYPGNRITVGRLSECNALVPSNEMIISKQHCIIEYNPQVNAFYVTDISTNGTFTQNGKRLQRNRREQVAPGSILYLSREYIIIQLNTFFN